MDEIALGLGLLATWRLWEQFQTDCYLRGAEKSLVSKYRDGARGAVFLFGCLLLVTLVVVIAEKWVRDASSDVRPCIPLSPVEKAPLCDASKSQAGIQNELVYSRNGNVMETTGQKSLMRAERMVASNTKTAVITAALEERNMTSNTEEQLPCHEYKHSQDAMQQQHSNNLQAVRSSRSNALRDKRTKIPNKLPVQSDCPSLTIDVSTCTAQQSVPTNKSPVLSVQSASPYYMSPINSPLHGEQDIQSISSARELGHSFSSMGREEHSHLELNTGDVVKNDPDNHGKITCSEKEKAAPRPKGSGGKHVLASMFTAPWNVMHRAVKSVSRHSGKHNHRKRMRKHYSDPLPLEGMKIALNDSVESPLINSGDESFKNTGGGRKMSMSTIGSDPTSEPSLDGIALGVMTVPICLASFILLMLQTHQSYYVLNGAPDGDPLPYVMILFECSLVSSLHRVITEVMLPLGSVFFPLRALVIVLAVGIAQNPLLCAWTMTIHQVLLTIMDQVEHIRKAELCVVTQAFALWIVDALLCTTFATFSSSAGDKWSKVFPIPPKRSSHFFVVQSGLIGLFASRAMVASMELLSVRWNTWQERRASTFIRQFKLSNPPATALPPMVACVVLMAGMAVTICWWMDALIEEESPILWICRQVFHPTYTYLRVGLCLYWVLVMALCFPLIPWVSERFKLRCIVARKLFHFVALAMFLPAVIFDSEFLSIAIGVALGLVILLEFLPTAMVPMVRSYYSTFLDHNDSNELAVTHIALLLGCALPLWLTNGAGATTCSPFPLNGPFLSASGILVLGIGDSAAAVVGSIYGQWNWTWAGNNRTVEGSVAMFVSLLIAFVLLNELTTSNTSVNCPELDHTCPLGLLTVLLPVGIVVIVEAVTTELDNIILPPYVFSSLVLLLLNHQSGCAANHLHPLQSID